MYLFCSSFFLVSRIFSSLMTITKSPVSTCGVKIVFSLPRSRLAAFTATRPSTWPWASMTHHLRDTSVAFAEKVFTVEKEHGNYGRQGCVSTSKRPLRHMSHMRHICPVNRYVYRFHKDRRFAAPRRRFSRMVSTGGPGRRIG